MQVGNFLREPGAEPLGISSIRVPSRVRRVPHPIHKAAFFHFCYFINITGFLLFWRSGPLGQQDIIELECIYISTRAMEHI